MSYIVVRASCLHYISVQAGSLHHNLRLFAGASELNPISSGAANEAVEAGTSQYHNITYWRENDLGGMGGLADRTVRYYVRCPGPDRWYIVHPMRLMNWMAYDATNGLIGIGDIILSDKGLLGDNFQGNFGDSNYP